MRLSTFIILSVFALTKSYAQNPKGFDEECRKYIKGKVSLIYPVQLNDQIKKSEIKLLDARERKEYNVSHLMNAQFIGYDNFQIEAIHSYALTDTIVVYCSIGYRSEKIGEKLISLGYKNVYNLYGGIFNWVNSGYKVVDSRKSVTKKVHGYDKTWSTLLNRNKCDIVVDK